MQVLVIDVCAQRVHGFGLGMYVKAKLEGRKEWWVTRVAPGVAEMRTENRRVVRMKNLSVTMKVNCETG